MFISILNKKSSREKCRILFKKIAIHIFLQNRAALILMISSTCMVGQAARQNMLCDSQSLDAMSSGS